MPRIPTATRPRPNSSPASRSAIPISRFRCRPIRKSIPRAPISMPTSIRCKAKVDAGASRAITQVFFDNDLYFRYLDRVRARGIDIPIVPGIMPMHNFKQARNFVTRAGTTVPSWLAEKFDGLDDDRRNPQAGGGHRCGRPGAEARQTRRRYLPFLHHEPRGSRVRHQPFARHSPAGRAESRLIDDRTRFSQANRSARGRPRAHPGARRRHGHHDPGPRI